MNEAADYNLTFRLILGLENTMILSPKFIHPMGELIETEKSRI